MSKPSTSTPPTQCFRVLVDSNMEAVIWVLHPFAERNLQPQFITIRSVDGSLSITAYFSELGDAEALALVGKLLRTPKVRAATVETIVATSRS